jgi:7,8-dihydropterin-6-yl-methyl-4-(beta-D-ribofuranosyl)aminobenzene 5'-phosphate synthase
MKVEALDSLEITVVLEDCGGYGVSLISQHGVAFLVRAQRGSTCKRILFDVAQNSEHLLYNLKRMEIPLSDIDMIVLSHGHRDHSRGVAEIISKIQEEKNAKNREREEVDLGNLPLIAHPDLFRPVFITDPYLRQYGMINADSREKIESVGGTLILSKKPLELMPGLLSTGEVERRTVFEDESELKLLSLVDGEPAENRVPEEIALVARVHDKGLVILTGCGHPGIINTIRQARAITGERKIEGIIGGLHLIDASNARIQATVEELRKLNIGWIAAGHCTGMRAQTELFRTFPGKFGPLRTGMVLRIPGDNFATQNDLIFFGGIKI